MQTSFSRQQLRDPRMAEAEAILRKCVHCGFCTATCPTYLLTGNELEGPRGRIYLIKDMLEGQTPAGPQVAAHLDHCLTCLSCMTTCPSGVDYNHLVEHARDILEETAAARPWHGRLWRAILAAIIPHPRRFAQALAAGRPFRPLAGLLERFAALRPAAVMLRMAPVGARAQKPLAGRFAPDEAPRSRVALLQGCAQSVLAAQINHATIAFLNRCGVEVVIPPASGCCGALTRHMGKQDKAQAAARANIAAWLDAGVEAVIVNASGCGVAVKDYGHLLGHDPEWAERAHEVSRMAKDIHEYLAGLETLPQMTAPQPLTVAFHAPCSLHHGQGLADVPARLLRQAGFEVRTAAESHICCGSAGVYSILEPEMSGRLKARKVAHLQDTGADVIASANYGCMHHMASGTHLPIVHVIELLEWAAGGHRPKALDETENRA